MTHQVLNEVELNDLNMESEWPLPVSAINTLMDGHSAQKIQDLGGIETIAVALRTNLKEGISAEEEQSNYEKRYTLYPFQRAFCLPRRSTRFIYFNWSSNKSNLFTLNHLNSWYFLFIVSALFMAVRIHTTSRFLHTDFTLPQFTQSLIDSFSTHTFASFIERADNIQYHAVSFNVATNGSISITLKINL
jgi:hypothetical protein